MLDVRHQVCEHCGFHLVDVACRAMALYRGKPERQGEEQRADDDGATAYTSNNAVPVVAGARRHHRMVSSGLQPVNSPLVIARRWKRMCRDRLQLARLSPHSHARSSLFFRYSIVCVLNWSPPWNTER